MPSEGELESAERREAPVYAALRKEGDTFGTGADMREGGPRDLEVVRRNDLARRPVRSDPTDDPARSRPFTRSGRQASANPDSSAPAPDANGRVRVLWVIKGLGAGGAERLHVSLAQVADHERLSLDIAYVLPHKAALTGKLTDAGVEVHCLTPTGGRYGLLNRLSWIANLRRLIARGDFDVVHTHSPVVAGVARLLQLTLRPSRRPAMVSTEHNSWGAYVPATRWLNAALHRRDDLRFAVSAEARDSMWSGWRRGVEVLTHGIVLDEYRTTPARRETARRALGIPKGTVVITTVANLRRQKGYPELMHAASWMTRTRSDLLFLAAGQGAQAETLQSLHRRLELGDRFRFLGQVDDIAELLAASDIFVLPSRFEGRPVAIMEALCVGLPVVATTVGGIPEQVTHGVEGLLIPPHDPEALAAALMSLVDDEGLRRRLGSAARERARQFDIRLAARRLEAAYIDLREVRQARRASADRGSLGKAAFKKVRSRSRQLLERSPR